MGIDDFKGCRPEFLPEDFTTGGMGGVGKSGRRPSEAGPRLPPKGNGTQAVKQSALPKLTPSMMATPIRSTGLSAGKPLASTAAASHHSMATRQVNRLAVRSTGNIRVTCRRRTALQLN